MTFADLLTGESVFLDANTLVYYFGAHPALGPASDQLIRRVENQDLFGFTSAHVLGEVSHRLMTIEANTNFGWPFAGIGNRLRNNPLGVQRLNLFRTAIDQALRSRLQVFAVTADVLADAMVLCQRIGMLTNDALIVAVMQRHGLTKLASHDGDFDRVPGLTRYAPA